MDDCPINRLPQDTLHQIFSSLPLRQIVICRSVCKFFNQILSSTSFLHFISAQPPLKLLVLRPSHHHHHRNRHVPPYSSLHLYDPGQNQWLRFNLDFLPFRSLHPVASSRGLIYVWAESRDSTEPNKSLIVCNPLTRHYKVLPQLGSAWWRHGSVLVDSMNRVMVLCELAALFFSPVQRDQWLKFSSNLPSKPRSPILVSNSVFALCDVGSPWRSQWKLFSCSVSNMLNLNVTHNNWECLERHAWGDIFDIMKRPRLVRGNRNKILMIGAPKSGYALNPSSSCLTILIWRLDLESMKWEEAGSMPVEMYKWFQESKFKVFGEGDMVCFSGKRVGRLALWECSKWRWIEGVPGSGDGLFRGFTFDAKLDAVP